MCAGKRRRSNTADPDAGAATGAAAAAAAYDQTPGGAAGAGFVPLQQQQVAISQQDMDSLQEAVRTNRKLSQHSSCLGRKQSSACFTQFAACHKVSILDLGHAGS